MSISAEFRQQFDRARKAAAPLQTFRPDIRIERSVFEGVFTPIKNIIDQTEMARQFSSPNGVTLFDQVKELRKMCLEAQVSSATDDSLLKQHRTELLNALQGIAESVEDLEKNNMTHVSVDYDDFFKMIDRTQEIRGAAKIYEQFLKNDNVASALFTVSENIKAAQANLWEPVAEQVTQQTVDA